MYKVRRKIFQCHFDAAKAAKLSSRIFPCHLRSKSGGAWYWHGNYCGRSFWSIFKKGEKA